MNDVPTRFEPKGAYGGRCMRMVYAARAQGRKLDMILRGPGASRSGV